MYEDMIAALMQDMQVDSVGARARALRDQPKPPSPPQAQMPPQAPPPGADLTGTWGQQMPQPGGMPPPPRPMQLPQQGPSPARQGPALPRAIGQGQMPPPSAPGPVSAVPGAPDPLISEYDRLAKQRDVLLEQQAGAYQPVDRTAAEAAYGRRAQEGPRMLLHALAAERVGKAGLAKHYYGAAGEADAPMKMAGGTMTPTGFIEDPGYQQELAIKRADLKLQQLQAALQNNITAQERRRLQREIERAADERQTASLNMQRTLAEYGRDTKLMVKGAGGGGGGGGDFGGPAVAVGTGGEGGSTVYRHTKSGKLFSYDTEGNQVAFGGALTPKPVAGQEPSEDERKTLGFLKQATQAYGEMRTALKTNPKAADVPFKESVLKAALPKKWGEDVAFARMTPERQVYTTAVDKFADAVLKVATGAGQSEEEARRKINELTPRYGETEESVAAKERGMKAYLEALAGRAGRAYTAAEKGGNAPTLPGSGKDSNDPLGLRSK